MTQHLHTSSHFSVLLSSVQEGDTMSKRNAEPITESPTAKQRPLHVRNLSAYIKVEKDNKGDNVVGMEHPSQTKEAGGKHQRQRCEPASSAASTPTL